MKTTSYSVEHLMVAALLLMALALVAALVSP
jgi:hypothetical protein